MTTVYRQKRHRRVPHKKGFYEAYIKRPQDFILALVALIILLPVMVVVAILVFLHFGAPVIFKQQRPGLQGELFDLYKFRTMNNRRDDKGELLPDEMRLTKFGRKLRSTSLDELPALLCVLQGTMSLVGPRPLLTSYLGLYSKQQARRHEVRPGFTGYAQVNGRNSITWEAKFRKDIYYVDHITFLGDWKIILQTVRTVLRREGIGFEDQVTMPAFEGVPAKLLIIGASGHGKVIADIASRCGYRKIAFLDDDTAVTDCMGYPIIGNSNDIDKYMDWHYFVAIGRAEIRERIQTRLVQQGCKVVSLIHPNAVLASKISVGIGTVIMAGAVINAGTIIGNGCIINTGATVDHDNVLEDYAHISVGCHLAGTVHVGKRTWLGIGAVVSNNISICSDCMIGAGAVVLTNIRRHGTYVGVPARRIREYGRRR